MSLDLRNFVQININYNLAKTSYVEKGIVTLITIDSAYSKNPFEKEGPQKNGIFYSLSDYTTAKENKSITSTVLDAYVESFFANKGKGLQIIGGYSTGEEKDFILSVLEKLDYRFIIIVSDVNEAILRAVAESQSSTTIAKNPLNGETTVSTFSGLNEKMFISSTLDHSGKFYNSISGDSAPTFVAGKYYEMDSDTNQYEVLQTIPDDWDSNYMDYFEVAECNLNNYIIKVGTKGIEMLAAAYLSRINVDDSSTVNDYAFTIETLKKENAFDFLGSLISENNVGVQLIESHFNFNTILVNAIRNYPGDTVSGADLTNYYVRILVTQDLTESIMNLLSSKIKFNQAGVNRLDNVISQELSRYVNNGYLNTDYIWTEDDLYYSFNNRDYLVCSRNTPLLKGYKCVILPLTALNAEQKESHVLPPVYILLADQTGIRRILINGDVF